MSNTHELGKYHITIFNAKKRDDKKAFSPYDDKTFVFQTFSTNSMRQMYSALVSHWVLNIPLNLTEPIRALRRKVVLDNYYFQSANYFILDIDDVKSEDDQIKIIEYFSKYKCVIGKSKSHNSINNFNMKGIIFISDIQLSDAKNCISNINHELNQWCTVDEAVSRKTTFNAPIGKNDILLFNEDGNVYTCSAVSRDIIKTVQDNHINREHINISLDFNFDQEPTTIEELCALTFKSMGFESVAIANNGAISFKHPSEKKTKGGYFWFKDAPYIMHHFNSTRSINIFDTLRKTEIGKNLMKKSIDYNDELLSFDTNTTVISINERFIEPDKIDIEEPIQNWLEAPDGLFSIKSPMGTGKSSIIKRTIDEALDSDMRILIITNRRSVAYDFAKKYSMKLYNKDIYNPGDSLIVQYDSLWKYNIKKFDLVIMDEFISLMGHSRSNLSNSSLNIAKFFACFNKKLLIADAFLTGYENFLLDHKKENILQLNNKWRDSTTLLSYECSNFFTRELVITAQKQKITVSSTSLNFLHSVKYILEKKGLKVVALTAETPDSTKELIYKLFEQNDHDKWDVFMYSPTLTVGVSNLNNVYKHFHYDTSMSTDVISSIQMIKRTRKTNDIHMYISPRINTLKTTYNDIRDEYMQNMGRNIDQNYLFDIDDYGEAKLSKVGRNAVKIDTFKNILEFDHKSAMLWMLQFHFLNKPRVITETYSENMISSISKKLKNNKKIQLESSINEFLNLNEVQKTDILMDSKDITDKSQKIISTLAEIDDNIRVDTPKHIRVRILNITLNNSGFIQHCKYYKSVFNYSRKLYELSDIKSKVSDAVINSNGKDLTFYNKLIQLGQVEIKDDYTLKYLKEFKLLKWILEQIGYRNKHTGLAQKYFSVNSDVKELYGYIK